MWTELACVTEVAVIAIPGATWLVRVTVSGGADLEASRLVDLRGGDEHAPLAGIADRPGGARTAGFAVPAGTRTADVHLELGGRSLELPVTPARRFARTGDGAPLDAELDALELRTRLSRAERRADELGIELRRRDAATAALMRDYAKVREGAERWHQRYRELRREAALIALRAAAPDAESASPAAPARPRRSRRRHTLACAAAGCVALVVLIGPGSGSGDRPPENVARAASPVTTRVGDIPSAWVRLYKHAGARYNLDWTVLAAVGAVESDHGRPELVGVRSGANSAGAAGPAQFLAATWQRFGVDADGNGVADPHNAADAVNAMAAYLRASGAPDNWRRALWAYNHSDDYAARVLRRAATYRRLAREQPAPRG